ncbi:MAG: glycosyltransferase family 4 protein [Anaerolineae bacterium]
MGRSAALRPLAMSPSTPSPTERRSRVLVISHDVVGAATAGPGMRYDNLARVLAPEFDVTLAAPEGGRVEAAPYTTALYTPATPGTLDALVAQADVIVVAASWFAAVPALVGCSAAVVIDGYDPALAEALFTPGVDLPRLSSSLTGAYLRGDFFLCASERQRDWWLGLLEASGRLNPLTIAGDPDLRHLLDVVPFGLPSAPLDAAPAAIDGIAADDEVVLWGGGLWEWLDPASAVRAMPLVLAERPQARLLFPGGRHPDPKVPRTRAASETEELARSLGLLGTQVIFGEWVPRQQYPGYLARADAGLSLHRATVEARLAYRTRVLDYVWAGVPMVLTEGDATAVMAAGQGLAWLVPPGDEGAVAQAVLQALAQPRQALAPAFAQARDALTWERAAPPLLEFCRHPHRAPDRPAGRLATGNHYYASRIGELERLVAGYERGRFIRLMRWLRSRQ